MKGRMQRRSRLTLGLVAANALLALLIGSLWNHDLTPLEAAETAKAERPRPGLSRLESALPPLDKYRGIVERNLFSSTRTAPPEISGFALAILQDVTLVGLATTPREQLALFLKKDGSVIRGRVGEWVEGWKLESVHLDRVQLSRGGTVQEMTLVWGSEQAPAQAKPSLAPSAPANPRPVPPGPARPDRQGQP